MAKNTSGLPRLNAKIWAHFLRHCVPQKTGLSACIFFARGKKGYRFYPLRGPNREAVWPFGVLLRKTPGIAASLPAGW
jgi:hypothetical protein